MLFEAALEKRTLVWAFAFTDGWMPFYDLLFVTVVLVVNVVVVVVVVVVVAVIPALFVNLCHSRK